MKNKGQLSIETNIMKFEKVFDVIVFLTRPKICKIFSNLKTDLPLPKYIYYPRQPCVASVSITCLRMFHS